MRLGGFRVEEVFFLFVGPFPTAGTARSLGFKVSGFRVLLVAWGLWFKALGLYGRWGWC